MTTDLKSLERKSEGLYTVNSDGTFAALPINRNPELEKRLERTRKTVGYAIAYGRDTFSDELWQAMEQRNFSQVKFARKAKVSKQFLTKIFRGENCTIETMVRLAYALDYKVNIHLTPNEIGCGWMHWQPEAVARTPQRFYNLWSDAGYIPVANFQIEHT